MRERWSLVDKRIRNWCIYCIYMPVVIASYAIQQAYIHIRCMRHGHQSFYTPISVRDCIGEKMVKLCTLTKREEREKRRRKLRNMQLNLINLRSSFISFLSRFWLIRSFSCFVARWLRCEYVRHFFGSTWNVVDVFSSVIMHYCQKEHHNFLSVEIKISFQATYWSIQIMMNCDGRILLSESILKKYIALRVTSIDLFCMCHI